MFSLIYTTIHNTCGQLIQRSDYRFMSREDLKMDIIPLKLHCHKCWSEINATHFEVWESERLGVEKIVDETTIDQLNNVCRKLTNSNAISNLQL